MHVRSGDGRRRRPSNSVNVAFYRIYPVERHIH